MSRDTTGIDVSRGVAGRTTPLTIESSRPPWAGPCCQVCSRPYLNLQLAARSLKDGCDVCGHRGYEKGQL